MRRRDVSNTAVSGDLAALVGMPLTTLCVSAAISRPIHCCNGALTPSARVLAGSYIQGSYVFGETTALRAEGYYARTARQLVFEKADAALAKGRLSANGTIDLSARMLDLSGTLATALDARTVVELEIAGLQHLRCTPPSSS